MRLLPPVAALLLAACSSSKGIGPFFSDGCTLFPDGKLGDRRLWCDCCFAHDVAYWRGGSRAEREAADVALRRCVFERTKDPRLAAVMYDAVRLGGAPYFPNWYRWGYGWPWGRTYEPVTAAEAAQAAERLAEYYRDNPGGYCQRR